MTERYIDFNRGDDANPGTILLPWKNVTKITSATSAVGGDLFLLANDSVWDYEEGTRVIPPSSWTGTRDNPVIIGSYSPNSAGSGKPTIRCNHEILASEWVYSAPDNAWVYTSPVLIGTHALVRIGNTWESSRIDGSGLPLSSLDGRWVDSGNSLYMYAPAETNPTDYYGGVLLGSNIGFLTISSGRGWVTVQDLRFEKTGTGIKGYSGSALDVGLTVKRIEGETVSGLISFGVTGADARLYASVSDCDISDWGTSAITAAAYGANKGGLRECNIFGNRISDGLHQFSQGAIYVQTSGLTTRIFNNTISGVRWGTLNKTTDGCAIYAETGSDNVLVYGNRVSDSVCAFQDNSGRSTAWYGNLVLNCGTAMRASDQESNNEADHRFVNNTCLVGRTITSAEAPFGSAPAEAGWRHYKPTGVVKRVLVQNNVFRNAGSAQDIAILAAEVTPAVYNYGHNYVDTSYADVARQQSAPRTIFDSAGSIRDSAEFIGGNYYPSSNSLCIAAGSHIDPTLVDLAGFRFARTPTIGAIEMRPTVYPKQS